MASSTARAMCKSKRFLFVWWDGGGNMPPALHLVRQLTARGHQVHVIGDPVSENAFKDGGATFSAFKRAPQRKNLLPESDPLRDWEAQTPKQAIRILRNRLLFGPALAYAKDTLEQIARFDPDALAIMDLTFGALLAAECSGIPAALIVPHILPYPVPGRPPFGPGLLPARNFAERLRDRVLSALLQKELAKGLPAFNIARTCLGLAPVAGVFDQVWRADRILVLTSEALELPGGPLPSNVRYTGPVLADPCWAKHREGPWPPGDGNPLVLLSLSSTFQDQRAVLQRAINALTQLPVRGVVTLGPALNVADFHAAQNIAIYPSVPHSQILPFADAMITHCGHGSVVRALAHRVPLICMPMGRDQNDIAARVVYHQAGLRISPASSTEEIRQAIENVLKNASYRDAARRIGDAIRKDAAESTTVHELEMLAIPHNDRVRSHRLPRHGAGSVSGA